MIAAAPRSRRRSAVPGLRAFTATTVATAVAGAALAGTLLVRGGEPDAPTAAVGERAATGFGTLALGTVTYSPRGDAVQIAATLANTGDGAVAIDPGAFRLRVPGRDSALAPAASSQVPDAVPPFAGTRALLRFRGPAAGRARLLEFRDPRGAPVLVDLRRVARGAASGGRRGHG